MPPKRLPHLPTAATRSARCIRPRRRSHRSPLTQGGQGHSYLYASGKLLREAYRNNTLDFFYDHSGYPYALTYNGTTYYYVTNLQGDVLAIVGGNKQVVASYTYDPYGKVLSATGTLAEVNPLRYRGYYYDTETSLYYLQSRYYDPTTCRFINADSYASTGQEMVGHNMFAYCGNNPIIGFDPLGMWDWGGFLVGAGLVLAGIATVATFGLAAPTLAIAVPLIATGAVTMYAAANDSAMVIDTSVNTPSQNSGSAKIGTSLVVDFEDDEIYAYTHNGGSIGTNGGLTYSVGLIDNYDEPTDYAGPFVDASVGGNAGIDVCWYPYEDISTSTRATSVTFSYFSTCKYSYGIGYDYYSQPIRLFGW